MINLNPGSISGRRRLSLKILLLRPNSYAAAESWDDLAYAFTKSLKNSSLDEMVLLLHTTLPDPAGWQSKYVRPVSYDRLDEVPELLLSMTPNVLETGTTPTQRPRVGAATETQLDGDRGGKGQQKCIDVPEERISDGKEVDVVISGGGHEEEIDKTRVDAAKAIQDTYRHYLERKRAGAARKIQDAYRRHLRRKNIIRQGIDATQAYYWHLLRRRSMEMEWSKTSRYYLLFRVPLAYILACLDAIKTFVESEKKEAKKRVMTEDDKDLEELMKALDQHRYDSTDGTLY